MNQLKVPKKTLLVILLALIGIICIMLLPFWNIQTITVTGNNYYTNEDILLSASLQEGTHSMRIQKKKLIQTISQLPYIDNVDIRYIFPNAVEIALTENEPMGYIAFSGTYLCIDNKGRVLTHSNEKILKLPEIKGIKTTHFKVGEPLEIENDDVFLEVCKIIDTLKTYDFVSEVGAIDVSNLAKIYLYVNKLDVIIGTSKDIEDKVKWLIEISKDYTMGTLDLTAIPTGDAVLTPLN